MWDSLKRMKSQHHQSLEVACLARGFSWYCHIKTFASRFGSQLWDTSPKRLEPWNQGEQEQDRTTLNHKAPDLKALMGARSCAIVARLGLAWQTEKNRRGHENSTNEIYTEAFVERQEKFLAIKPAIYLLPGVLRSGISCDITCRCRCSILVRL